MSSWYPLFKSIINGILILEKHPIFSKASEKTVTSTFRKMTFARRGHNPDYRRDLDRSHPSIHLSQTVMSNYWHTGARRSQVFFINPHVHQHFNIKLGCKLLSSTIIVFSSSLVFKETVNSRLSKNIFNLVNLNPRILNRVTINCE